MKPIALRLGLCLIWLFVLHSALAQPGNDPLEQPLPRGAVARFGTTRFRAGSTWASNLLAMSPDGKRLVSGGYGGTLIWDIATGQLLRQFPARPVGQNVHFSANGRSLYINELVSAAVNSTSVLNAYDIDSGKLLRVFEGAKTLGTFALAPDGKTVALEFSAMDRQLGPSDFEYVTHLELRDVETDRLLHSFGAQRTTLPMGHLLFSEDGKSLFAVSSEMNRTGAVPSIVRHFDSATAALKAEWKIDAVSYFRRLNTSKGLLATGHKIWDLDKGQLRTTLVGGEKGWSGSEGLCQLLPDGKSAVIAIPPRNEHYQGRYGASSRQVEPARFLLWDIVSDKEIRRLPEHWGGFIAPDGKSSFTVTMGGAIHHWDLATDKEILPLESSDENAHTVVFSPDQKWLVRVDLAVRGNVHWQVSVWDVATCKRVHHDIINENPRVGGLHQFTPDSRTFLIGGSTRVHTFDLPDWKHATRTLADLKIEADAADWARCRLSPNGKSIAVCYSNIRGDKPVSNTVEVWDWPSGTKSDSWDNTDDMLFGFAYPAAYAADGKWFAATVFPRPKLPERTPSTGWPASIRIWDAVTGKIVRTWSTSERHLTFLQFSSDRKTIVGRFHSSKVYVWDTATGQEKLTFEPKVQAPTNLWTAASPNGKLLATSDQNTNRVQFWNLETGKQVGEFQAPHGHITSLSFAPDSRLLAAGVSDTTVLLIDVQKLVEG